MQKHKWPNAIDCKEADLVAFGVPFIANPDLVNRTENKLELAHADPLTYFTTGDKGFTDYPALR